MSEVGKSMPPPGPAEKTFAGLVLLLSTGAFMNLGVTDAAGDPEVGVRALWYAAYLIIAALFLRKCPEKKQGFLAVAPLVPVVAFAMATSIWSQDPALSFRHSVVLGLALLLGVYFGSRYSFAEQLGLLTWVFGTCVIFSFIFGLLGLGTAVDAAKNVPGWYGIFIQKNVLGRVMVLSAMVFFFWGRAEPDHKTIARMGFFASLVLVVLSRSMTSTVTFIVVMVLLLYLRWALRKGTRWIFASLTFLSAAGVAATLFVITHLQQVTSLLGRGPTLTGRVQLWILSFVMALRRPWLGYGYEAFWLPDKWYVRQFWQVLGWNMPSAHNGFLELWLELGIIGTGLFLLGFAHYFVRALRLARYDSRPAAWSLALLMFLFFIDLTEPIFLGANSIFFVLYVAAATSLCNELDKRRAFVTLAVPRRHYA